MSSGSGSGEYPRAPAQKARDENILTVFDSTEDPVLATSEVASELPIGKRATLNRLEQLVERGELDSKDVGVGRVWWRAEPVDLDPEPVATGPVGVESGPDGGQSPRWAFVGTLGTHSIYAGIFLFGILVAEATTQGQQLVPIPPQRLFLTAFVFFLIGIPSRVAYRAKQYLDERDIQFWELLPFDPGEDETVT